MSSKKSHKKRLAAGQRHPRFTAGLPMQPNCAARHRGAAGPDVGLDAHPGWGAHGRGREGPPRPPGSGAVQPWSVRR